MTHLSPSFWVHTTSKSWDKSSCLQTKAPHEKVCFCFEMKILPFSGILRLPFSCILSKVRSIVEITKVVQSKSLLCTQELIQKHCPTKHCPTSAYQLSVVWLFFVFYLFRYSLISIHSVKKNSTRTAVGVILNTLWWLCYFGSFSKVATKLSCLFLLLD